MLSDILTPSGIPSNDTTVTIVALIVSQVIQSLWFKWVNYIAAKKIKEDLRIKSENEKRARIRAAKRTAKVARIAQESLSINMENSEVNKKVYDSVNGNGLGGQMKLVASSLQDVVSWQDAHEARDNQRLEEIVKRIDASSNAIHARLAAVIKTIADNQKRIDDLSVKTKESTTTTVS